LVRTVISISLDEETLPLVAKAEEICKKEGKKFNLSGILREIIKEQLIKFVTGHGDGNPGSTIDQFFDGGFIITPALARAEKPEDIEKYLKSIVGTKQFEQVGEFLTVWVQKYNTLQEPSSF
jgi:hypothetical protein